MLVAAAATLGRPHQAAASALDAARALRPLADAAAADLFAAGLVTSALVALPVVMASTAYVVGAHFNWRRGLSERAGRARRFCAILAASIGLALVVSLAKIPVIGMAVLPWCTVRLSPLHREHLAYSPALRQGWQRLVSRSRQPPEIHCHAELSASGLAMGECRLRGVQCTSRPRSDRWPGRCTGRNW
jgi:hypothetical protein